MIELTGLGSVLRGIGALYWALAVGLLSLALWKGKGTVGKALWAGAVVVVFGYLPVTKAIEHSKKEAYAREAWAYFKKKCDIEAGEKIYKTFTGVKSVLIVKPLPPATEKDLYDQFWYGDPYSDATPHEKRAESAALRLAYQRPGDQRNTTHQLEFVESPAPDSTKIIRYYYVGDSKKHSQEIVDRAVSRFGISWEDISTPEDRNHWVAASRLRIVDLAENSVIAERIGYLIEVGFGSNEGQRRPWLVSREMAKGNSCPAVNTYSDRSFILRVLNSGKQVPHGK
jgi:hypothetical protein